MMPEKQLSSSETQAAPAQKPPARIRAERLLNWGLACSFAIYFLIASFGNLIVPFNEKSYVVVLQLTDVIFAMPQGVLTSPPCEMFFRHAFAFTVVQLNGWAICAISLTIIVRHWQAVAYGMEAYGLTRGRSNNARLAAFFFLLIIGVYGTLALLSKTLPSIYTAYCVKAVDEPNFFANFLYAHYAIGGWFFPAAILLMLPDAVLSLSRKLDR